MGTIGAVLLAAGAMLTPAVPAQAAAKCNLDSGFERDFGYGWAFDNGGNCGTIGLRLKLSPSPSVEYWTAWSYDPDFIKLYSKQYIVTVQASHTKG